ALAFERSCAAATPAATRQAKTRTPTAPTRPLRVICVLLPLGLTGRGYNVSGAREAHAFVHRLERRGGRLAGLVGAAREQAAELRLVGADLLVASADRLEDFDDRLGDGLLEPTVTPAVVRR